MYAPHPVFHKPDNPNQILWRYQDLAKLLNLIQTSQLFFSRADALQDAFEGSYPRANEAIRAKWVEEVRSEMQDKSKADNLVNTLTHANLIMREWVYVNCWHLNDVESAAMWKIYGESNYAIAPRSTYSRLENALKKTDLQVHVGIVSYIDYDNTPIPEGNAFYAYLHKRRSFAFENELRAAVLKPTDQQKAIENNENELQFGLHVDVNLDDLIEDIYISPSAPHWFASTVRWALHNSGLQKEVFQSKLGEKPFF